MQDQDGPVDRAVLRIRMVDARRSEDRDGPFARVLLLGIAALAAWGTIGALWSLVR